MCVCVYVCVNHTQADEKEKPEEKETIDSFVFTSPGVEEPAQFKTVIDGFPQKWPSYQTAYIVRAQSIDCFEPAACLLLALCFALHGLVLTCVLC